MSNPKILPLPRDFVPREGAPSVESLNQRSLNASNSLKLRGAQPQVNPLVMGFQLNALVNILERKGILTPDDLNDFQYEIVRIQTETLEQMVAQTSSGLVVAGN